MKDASDDAATVSQPPGDAGSRLSRRSSEAPPDGAVRRRPAVPRSEYGRWTPPESSHLGRGKGPGGGGPSGTVS